MMQLIAPDLVYETIYSKGFLYVACSTKPIGRLKSVQPHDYFIDHVKVACRG
jgi:hypothetical protein